MRLTRGLVPIALAATALLPNTSAHAVTSLAYTFALDCANPAVIPSAVELASGTYAVTVAGECSAAHGGSTTFTVATPCVATLPCTSTSINNVPSTVCTHNLGGVLVRLCGGSTATPLPSPVAINGTPVTFSHAGLLRHGGGVMTARYLDVYHGDNIGRMTVTAVWTAA